MPDQRIKLAAAVTDTYAYIIGGDIAGKPSSEVHKAPINADGSLGEWARTADLPEQRTGACAARYQNHIYVVGGGGGGTDYASVRRGDAGPDGAIAAWSLETMGLSSSVSGASCVIHGNRLYVVGGYGHLTKVSQATLAPDGKISSWLGDVEMKHAHAYFAAAAAGEFLYAIGGFDSSSTMPSETDVVEVAKFTSSGLGPFTLTTPLPGGTRHFLTGFGTP
jgi:N-acetylneuraminic acid mutarotase